MEPPRQEGEEMNAKLAASIWHRITGQKSINRLKVTGAPILMARKNDIPVVNYWVLDRWFYGVDSDFTHFAYLSDPKDAKRGRVR